MVLSTERLQVQTLNFLVNQKRDNAVLYNDELDTKLSSLIIE